jgi:hypothetical protein
VEESTARSGQSSMFSPYKSKCSTFGRIVCPSGPADAEIPQCIKGQQEAQAYLNLEELVTVELRRPVPQDTKEAKSVVMGAMSPSPGIKADSEILASCEAPM